MMRGASQQPIIVLSQGTKRESGHQVQIGNINACKVRKLHFQPKIANLRQSPM